MRPLAILSALFAVMAAYAVAMHISAQPTYHAPAHRAPAERCILSAETIQDRCYIDARDLLDGCRIDAQDIADNCNAPDKEF